MEQDDPEDIISEMHDKLDELELSTDDQERLSLLEELTTLLSNLHASYVERRTK